MNDFEGVLVFSRRGAGAVRAVVEVLREKGQRPVLVSERPNDPNRDLCDAHLVIDWDEQDLKHFVAAVEAAGVVPAGIVNVVESLMAWQIAVARLYGLPGGEKARETFLSKARVRTVMRDNGYSDLWFAGGFAGSFEVGSVPRYPVIVKPARDTGGSRLVRKADTPEELGAALDAIADAAGDETELVIEEYIEGVEFSVDGPVVDGVFHGIFVVEKTQHNEQRHHDAGLRLHPPVSAGVTTAARELSGKVGALCRDLEFSQGWLHVEGRAGAGGAVELVEINVRSGGGLYRVATRHACHIDPVDVVVSVALGQPSRTPRDTPRDCRLALIPFDADRVGDVVDITPLEEMKALPEVLDGYVLDSYRVYSLDYENFVAEFLVHGDDAAHLLDACRRVTSAFSYRIA
ncbi:hypothetical protein GCM10010260_12680 [Streptomyces filipinensis]|uniref:ATP-grasp domain-containing protein n=1 Tax=Streptomyces filipinensis TaxID=66887 RepID=A0A918M906_9ACTN|nr:ATP-grasp domain-containing protein [Streptomyces filipinensis]GGU81685.1 hypothetical protein GCM10010260_12680 [Streptomyces filipinensis]